MNKSDLVDAVAAATNEGKSKVATLLEAVLDHISAALQKGEKVTLPGFGTFETRKRQARSGRNPRTGAPVKIAATTAPVFKAGATLKGSVAGNKKTAAKGGARSKASAKAKAAPKAAAKTAAKAAGKVSARAAAVKPKAAPKTAAKAPAKSAAKTSAKASPKAAAKASAKAAPGNANGGVKGRAKKAAARKR
ncbi:MAG TPA: HU family DNA-binding protein [Actinomycetota bacterium]|jgi:DNA-binding protein HU-beta|nr:HU family DNA-binding protein [Actinomycetota bacterium]